MKDTVMQRSSQHSSQQSDTQRLLIVDDDELVGRTLELIAKREGYEARVTCDPDRFLDLVGEWQPDIVAIDLVILLFVFLFCIFLWVGI